MSSPIAPMQAARTSQQVMIDLCRYRTFRDWQLWIPADASKSEYLRSKGFDAGQSWESTQIPELVPLAALCEHILVRSDGMAFSVCCVMDAKSELLPKPAQLEAVAAECLKFTGFLPKSRRKIPVGIRLFMVSDSALSQSRERELQSFKSHNAGCALSWTFINTHTGKVLCSDRKLNSWSARREGEQILKTPSNAPQYSEARAVPAALTAKPIATYGIAAALVAAFAWEVWTLGGNSVTGATAGELLQIGALQRKLVFQGEWYRLVTATFLHGGIFHLFCNLLALVQGCALLERIIGRSWFLVIYALSGLLGGVASMMWNGNLSVSVGASGAIMGLIGATAVMSDRLPNAAQRLMVRRRMIEWGAISLIPSYGGGGRIDISAHAGGLIGGVLLALLLSKLWSREKSVAPHHSFATVLAGAFCVVSLYSLAIPARQTNSIQTAFASSAPAGGKRMDGADYLRAAAENGDAVSQYNLAIRYDNGDKLPKDKAEAVKWYRKAVDQGYAPAQLNLGVIYLQGDGVPKDYAESARLTKLAAAKNLPLAQANLGLLYSTGAGVEKNLAEAAAWYRKAAENGVVTAQRKLGLIYRFGNGVAKDPAESLKWLRKAADSGDTSAQFYIGLIYEKGQGVPIDLAESARWYQMSAEKGDAWAQTNLGLFYSQGKGVKKDFDQAAKWYRAAAAQNDSLGEFNLGIVYFNGEGVAKDVTEAMRLFRKAAEGKSVLAQRKLANVLVDGHDVPKDETEGLAWMTIAAASGDERSVKGLELLKKKLDPKVIEAAKVRSKQLLGFVSG